MNEVRFRDLLSQPLRNGVTRPKAVRVDGTKMVNMGELFSQRRIGDIEMSRVPLEGADSRFLLKSGDLLFARRSLVLDGAGLCSIFVGHDETTFESSIIRARLDPAKADPRYFTYYFSSPEGRRRMESIVEQVAAAGIRSSDLSQLRVPCPPVVEQRRVAEMLWAIDDKIDLNKKTSAKVEELMHATYAGRWRTNDRSIAIADIVECHRDPVDPRQVGPDTIYVGLEHMTPRSLNLEKHGRAMDVGSGKSAFQPGDVLFGRLRPYFHKVAVAHTAGIASQEILVLRPKSPELLGLAICEVSHPALIEHATAVSTGTRMPRASWSDIARFRFGCRGSTAEITAFVSPLLNIMQGYIRESETLTQLRDLLLPKLMTGEIRLKDAEKTAAEAL